MTSKRNKFEQLKKITNFFRKPVVSKPLNSIAFNGNQQMIIDITLSFDDKAKIWAIVIHQHISSNSEGGNKYKQKPKYLGKFEKTLSEPLKPYIFSVNFIYDLLKVSSLPMGSSNKKIMSKMSKEIKVIKKSQKFLKIMKIRGIEVIKTAVGT